MLDLTHLYLALRRTERLRREWWKAVEEAEQRCDEAEIITDEDMLEEMFDQHDRLRNVVRPSRANDGERETDEPELDDVRDTFEDSEVDEHSVRRFGPRCELNKRSHGYS